MRLTSPIPATSVLLLLFLCGSAAHAEEPDPVPAAATKAAGTTVQITARTSRSAVALAAREIQLILPGTNPLRALQALPGVSFQTADPWGNNEQNLSLFVHGFNGQQLGYTLDGVPLGDQQYGNYNGLSPQRAIISENVRSVLLSSGAGDLGTASTSNLGGTIDVFSMEPSATPGASVAHTIGSHAAARSYVRVDSGRWGEPDTSYALAVSLLRQRARAWDFNATQGGEQANVKLVRQQAGSKLTLYANYADKAEPNEDSIVHVAGETSAPEIRPFLYPDLAAALSYLTPAGGPPAAAGANYLNYFGVAQRRDKLAYAKYEIDLGPDTQWSSQAYFHGDDGIGAVAGPVGVAGLPALFAVYFPGQDLKQAFGGSGYAVRATEYQIRRAGLLSSVRSQWGAHRLQFGGWIERNRSRAYRRWYRFNASHPTTPYQLPADLAFTQYGSEIDNVVAQLHAQDEWCALPGLCLQAGFKSSLQFADGSFPVQPRLGAIAGGSTALPEGEITTKKWFLPQAGVVWDAGRGVQLFFNAQRNLRQFVTYGAVGPSPWSLADQSAFNLFKATARPETSVTLEGGLRTQRTPLATTAFAFDGQLSFYHVDFRDRLLQISPTPVISSIVNGNPILANVGSVRTDGFDVAGTLYGAPGWSFYNALSYNRSRFVDDYDSGTAMVHTGGKMVPGSPTLLNKFIASARVGGAELSVIGDYVGKRYATYTNDLSVPPYFMTSLALTTKLAPFAGARKARLTLNVSNLDNARGILTPVIGAASGTYNSYPIAPRQVFLTLALDW
jgi:iron complex outermembrane receptor protein